MSAVKQSIFKSYTYSSDPFLCHSKNLEEEHLHDSQTSPLLSSCSYEYTAYCSSGPSSPGSTYSTQSNFNQLPEPEWIKQEFDDYFRADSHPSFNYQCDLPPFDSVHDNLCEIPIDFASFSDQLIQENLIGLYDVNSETNLDIFPAVGLLDENMDKATEESIKSIPAPLEVDMKALPPTDGAALKQKARVGRPKRSSPPTQAPISSPVTDYKDALESVRQWNYQIPTGNESRSGSVTSSAESTSTTTVSKGGATVKRLRTTVERKVSPTAYADRRRKNNIAVRKSREKKRQEINRFTEEHMKLQKQCEMLRLQNEKLMATLNQVQEALVDDGGATTPIRSLIATAKKQLNLP